MTEKRRPPSLHRGPAPAPEREPIPIPDPGMVTFAFVMTNREVVTTTTRREKVDTMSEEISAAIAHGRTVTLHDPSGHLTIINTAHVVHVSAR